MKDQKICFVIAPIGREGSEIRRRSEQVLKYIIFPACAEHEYSVIRADLIAEPGLITSQIIEHIIKDDLVIADLTGQNPNVFYELAIRHFVGKQVIQIIEKGEAIPFDVGGIRTIQVNMHDIDSVESAKNDLARFISSVESGETRTETPISIARDIAALRKSPDKDKHYVAELATLLRELKQDIQKLPNDIEHILALSRMNYKVYDEKLQATLKFLLNKGESLAKIALERNDKELLAYAHSIIELSRSLTRPQIT